MPSPFGRKVHAQVIVFCLIAWHIYGSVAYFTTANRLILRFGDGLTSSFQTCPNQKAVFTTSPILAPTLSKQWPLAAGYSSTNNDNDSEDSLHAENDPDQTSREKHLINLNALLTVLVGQQKAELDRLHQKVDQLQATNQALVKALRSARKCIQSRIDASKSDLGLSTTTSATRQEDSETMLDTKANASMYFPILSNELFDETTIFGNAPASVQQAGCDAGRAALGAMLMGNKRMLVDIRDPDLATDMELLLEVIEAVVKPLAEGLRSSNHRVRIVFPQVTQLVRFRQKGMSKGGIDSSVLSRYSTRERNKLLVVVAPRPDDTEKLQQMQRFIADHESDQSILLLNYHTEPVKQLPVDLEPVYHMQLFSLEPVPNTTDEETEPMTGNSSQIIHSVNDSNIDELNEDEIDAVVDQALERPHAPFATSALLVRSFPNPWHLFMDLTPSMGDCFEVVATFDTEPSEKDLDAAITECLEGSEREDAIVRQEMKKHVQLSFDDDDFAIVDSRFFKP
eukprot:Nitzschia sp. Nitz4//scaffold33_size148984//91813//93410//NITZ4_002936-RA/size148984-snap-gene-0.9-mRNA-1//1//CDS//3329548451//2408//frame0